jgi:hypothetical protein
VHTSHTTPSDGEGRPEPIAAGPRAALEWLQARERTLKALQAERSALRTDAATGILERADAAIRRAQAAVEDAYASSVHAIAMARAVILSIEPTDEAQAVRFLELKAMDVAQLDERWRKVDLIKRFAALGSPPRADAAVDEHQRLWRADRIRFQRERDPLEHASAQWDGRLPAIVAQLPELGEWTLAQLEQRRQDLAEPLAEHSALFSAMDAWQAGNAELEAAPRQVVEVWRRQQKRWLEVAQQLADEMDRVNEAQRRLEHKARDLDTVVLEQSSVSDQERAWENEITEGVKAHRQKHGRDPSVDGLAHQLDLPPSTLRSRIKRHPNVVDPALGWAAGDTVAGRAQTFA